MAGAVLAGVTAGAMVLRWRLPFEATLTAGAVTVIGTVLGVCQDPMLATAWCLYPLAIERARRTRAVAGVLAGLFAGLAMVTGVPEGEAAGPGRQVVLAVAALSVAWLLGTATGRQIAIAREAERMRVQLEVARDVHDVVGHALGTVLAQSGVILSLPDAREEELRDTLAEVEAHARKALEDVQGLVRTLRVPDGESKPGLGGLAEVVEVTRAAGVEVDARIDVGGAIDDGVGVVAFRIAQEALSNVVRHAPGARCTVRVRREGDVLVVRVRDGGARRAGGRVAAAGSGVGLRGMRERARLVGGTVVWGARPEGGFEVEARLPAESVS
ncbi:two-component sensor histidine kinase [Planobispora siamensis]|uniref:histidine kinase n=1 Tax=Planobispora siamensis TaxID=936338 RepID=A0A8J3SN82_9ACTN|nr:two-component sensor histidine kinase [Planobispora siamensis]